MKTKKNKARRFLPIAAVFFGILFILAAVVYILTRWVDATYDVDFNTLIYTMLSPLKGTGNSVVDSILQACLPSLFCVWFCILYRPLCFASPGYPYPWLSEAGAEESIFLNGCGESRCGLHWLSCRGLPFLQSSARNQELVGKSAAKYYDL